MENPHLKVAIFCPPKSKSKIQSAFNLLTTGLKKGMIPDQFFIFFSMIFTTLFFSQKNAKVYKKLPKWCQRLAKIWPLVDFFWFSVHRVFERPYNVFAIFHWFALLQIARKTHQKHAWKSHAFYNNILKQKNWNITENDVQNDPQNVTPKPGRPFWSIPGAHLAPQRFFNTKNVNQVLQK